ncbi:hypothetical protein [Sphingomonas sp. LM7]|uniref:hypothetical protein n=1 Tax=Sphingomonas sp. LM7 TaxID=1938607 RepID=UPI0009839D2B|nr:hypothetical protein [Sphingomonas sp. LM7]AQR73210.1 hypothetical protein BXU08_05500 [Sphingomonas sp. LM7]
MADEKNSDATAPNTTGTSAPDTANGDTRPAINFETPDDTGPAKPGATQQLKDEASKLGSQAADRAREYAGQGKERATTALDEVAKMFEGAALDVDARLGEEYGKYARSAAQGISSFADSLRGKEVDDLITDATELVKKSPVIAVGAAAAVGFVLARLIKSGVDAASTPPKDA